MHRMWIYWLSIWIGTQLIKRISQITIIGSRTMIDV